MSLPQRVLLIKGETEKYYSLGGKVRTLLLKSRTGTLFVYAGTDPPVEELTAKRPGWEMEKGDYIGLEHEDTSPFNTAKFCFSGIYVINDETTDYYLEISYTLYQGDE
ncbi:hypothetical protein ES703_71004 [subsurface metagenome]